MPDEIDTNGIADAVISRLNASNGGQQMSEEELNKLLQRMIVGQSHLDRLFGDNTTPENRMQALQEIVSGAVREAVTASHHLMRGEFEQREQRWSPMFDHVHEMVRDKTLGEFFKEYPTLEDFRDTVMLVGQTHGNAQVKSKKELFDLIAAESSKLVQKARPDFVLKSEAGTTGDDSSSSTTKQQQSPNTMAAGTGMASLSSGSQAGASAAPARNTKETALADVWD